jgi:hypothetical protein
MKTHARGTVQWCSSSLRFHLEPRRCGSHDTTYREACGAVYAIFLSLQHRSDKARAAARLTVCRACLWITWRRRPHHTGTGGRDYTAQQNTCLLLTYVGQPSLPVRQAVYAAAENKRGGRRRRRRKCAAQATFLPPSPFPPSVNGRFGCFYCACSPAPLRPNPSSMGIGCSCTHVISVNY